MTASLHLRRFLVVYIFHTVCRNSITATQQIKNGNEDPLEYKLTKLLDIHVGKDSNSFPNSLRDSVRSEVQNVLAGLKNELTDTKQNVNLNRVPVEPRDVILQQVLGILNSEISQIKANISILLTSSNYQDNIKNFLNKSPVGVNYDDQVCSGFSSKQLYPKSLWTNSSYVPKNCKEIQSQGYNVSGVYKIQPLKTEKPFMVLCDMETQGGGWTHVQKRYDGSQDFYLNWREYKFGFGNLEREFWLGLENIYALTSFEKNELLIELVDVDNTKKFAHYKAFEIGSESTGYPLKVLNGFSGDAGDSLATFHAGMKFSTKDFDQDEHPGNCAEMFSGAWWYKNCHSSNLNGKYRNAVLPNKYANQGIHWKTFKFYSNSLSKTRILVRPIQP